MSLIKLEMQERRFLTNILYSFGTERPSRYGWDILFISYRVEMSIVCVIRHCNKKVSVCVGITEVIMVGELVHT